MKGIIVYDTSYGNTKKIGETITETLKASGIGIDLFYVKDVKNLSAKEYDFLSSWFSDKIWHNEFDYEVLFGQSKK